RHPRRHVPDDLVRALELLADAGRAAEMQLAVPQGVITDEMAQVGDAARDGGKAPHVLAHQEERRRDLVGGQGRENRLGGAGVGAVVERQVGDAPTPRAATDDPAEQGLLGSYVPYAQAPSAAAARGRASMEEIKQEAPGTAR